MKKIFIALLAASMLFAFVACDDDNGPSFKAVRNYNELVGAIEAGEKNIVLASDIEIADGLELDVDGLTIKGDGHSMTVSSANGTGFVVNVLAPDVIIDDVDFVVSAIGVRLIEAGNSVATGFTFKNSSITGETWSVENEGNSASVIIGLNLSTGGEVINSEFVDCYTPIYVNASSIKLNGVKFNSGIVFGAEVSADDLNNLEIAEGEYDKANIDFTNISPDADNLNAIKTKFGKTGIEIRTAAN